MTEQEPEPEPVAHEFYYPMVIELKIVKQVLEPDDFIDNLGLNNE